MSTPSPTPNTTSFSCPFCRRKLRVKVSSAGKRARCPNPQCGQSVVVPAPVAEAPLELDDAPAPTPFELDDPPPARPARRRPAPVEDDAPARPSRALVWVAVGAVALLFAGGGIAVWQLTKKPHDETAGGGGGGLPGGSAELVNLATGPRVVELGKPPEGVHIERYYVASEYENGVRRTEPVNQWPQTLPSGTDEVRVGVGFTSIPNGTNVRVEVSDANGPVKLRGGLVMTIRSPSGTVIEFDCTPRDGPFADGQYKAKVFVNDKEVAEMNWAVGGRLVGVDAYSLTGTRWRSDSEGGFGDSGYRLEFGSDGTFTYTTPGQPPAKGRWKAEGETFTAFADPPPGATKDTGGGRHRTELKGLCLKDELRVKIRTEYRDGTPGGAEKFGGWHAIPICRKDDGKPPRKDGGKATEADGWPINEPALPKEELGPPDGKTPVVPPPRPKG